MRRGRTVEIKRLKRPSEPFVILPANCSTLLAAAAKVLSPKQLDVRWTVSVLVSAERSSLARLSSARYPGHDRTSTSGRASLSWTPRTTGPATSADDEALVKYGRISSRPLPTWRQRSVRTAGDRTVRSWCQKNRALHYIRMSHSDTALCGRTIPAPLLNDVPSKLVYMHMRPFSLEMFQRMLRFTSSFSTEKNAKTGLERTKLAAWPSLIVYIGLFIMKIVHKEQQTREYKWI